MPRAKVAPEIGNAIKEAQRMIEDVARKDGNLAALQSHL